jgi:hypothetical protein
MVSHPPRGKYQADSAGATADASLLFCLFVSPYALSVMFPRVCFHLPLFLKFGVVLFDFFFRCCCCCCVFSFVSVELLSPQAKLSLLQLQLSSAALLGAGPTSGPYLFTLDFMANSFLNSLNFLSLVHDYG